MFGLSVPGYWVTPIVSDGCSPARAGIAAAAINPAVKAIRPRRRIDEAVIAIRSRETLEECDSKPSQELETRIVQSYYPAPAGSDMRHRKLRIRGNETAKLLFHATGP